MNIIRSFSSVVREVGEYIFPRRCHLCGTILSDTEHYLCATCIARLPRTLYHLSDMNPMEQRFAGIIPFEHATGHFFYSASSELAQLMHDLKYRHYRGLAQAIGEIIASELFTSPFLSDIDAIMPVPMYFIKKARRGYNQTEEIAKGVAEITGKPILTNLKAIRPHRTQTKLTLAQRRRNTSGIFRLDRPQEISGKHLLLLDDVCTTGSTLTNAAEAILTASPTTRLSLLTVGVTF